MSKASSIDMSQFRFAYYSNKWEINLQQKYTLKETYNIIKNNKQFLEKIGDLNNSYILIHPPIYDKSESPDCDFSGFQEFEDYVKSYYQDVL